MTRIAKMQSMLTQYDALIIEDPIDLFYFTQMTCSAGRLILGKKDVIFLTDGRYLTHAKTQLSCSVKEISWQATELALQEMQATKVAFDGAKMSFDRAQELCAALTSYSCSSWSFATKLVRAYKETEEIAALQKSATLLWQGYMHILAILQEGMTEKEVAKAFHLFCLAQGAEALSFSPIIAFGDHSALPHHRASQRTLKRDDIVLIDIGVVVDGYASDMTRVIFFGNKDPYLASLLKIVQEAELAALSLCKPGVSCAILDQAARTVFRQYDVESHFVHSLGHGVGLEVHEYPRIRSQGEDAHVLLEPGMVITIEPGLYIPGIGGARYEDTIVVTKDGYCNFFPSSIL